jgi:hypothetical protein
MINAPWSHDSLCTYMPQGVNTDDPTKIARFLDVSLRFFPTVEAAQAIHQATLDQFHKMAASPDAPFKITAINPIEGITAQAFYVELQADPGSEYKSVDDYVRQRHHRRRRQCMEKTRAVVGAQ